AGDLACAMAQRALPSVPLPAVRVRAACDELARMQHDVIAGQLLDMRASAHDRCAGERVHELKTWADTVRGPLAIGAHLAGATTAQQDALAKYAKPVGVAFQLRDDLLGTFGDQGTTGKSNGADIRRGKRTALVVELEGDTSAKALLERAFGRE